MNKQIYIILKGRIGNQLFIYGFARELQKRLNKNSEIIIDDCEVTSMNWENSLVYYDLQNVRYVHNRKEAKSIRWFFKFVILRIAEKITKCEGNFQEKYKKEKFIRPFLELCGVYLCENGYIDFKVKNQKRILLSGYFQSEQYFMNVRDELKNIFSLKNNLQYNNLDLLESSNSVCVSIKVEHNVGSSMYAVCGKEYWKEAINYIITKVKDPVFFICSDNIDYVKKHLIDCSKYKAVFQDTTEPVYKSLAAMSRCKHFIIGNTTFAWWAQFLSNNPNKITIAPNQWMLVDMPISIYEDNWTLIDVKKYLGDKAL